MKPIIDVAFEETLTEINEGLEALDEIEKRLMGVDENYYVLKAHKVFRTLTGCRDLISFMLFEMREYTYKSFKKARRITNGEEQE